MNNCDLAIKKLGWVLVELHAAISATRYKLFIIGFLCFFFTACSPKVIIRERIVVRHDTVCMQVPVPARTYPEGWLGRTQRALDSLCATSLLQESQLGMCVLDLTDGVQVYEHGARQRMRPASTMKVVTAVTAMSSVLDNPYAFTLRCYKKPNASTNDLLLVGGMDPLLSYTDLCRLADTLVVHGIVKVNDIVLDVSLADTTRWGEGWCWDDENEAMTPFLYMCATAARGGKGSSRLSWRQMPETPFVSDLRKVLAARNIKIEGKITRSMSPSYTDTCFVGSVGHTWDDVLRPMMKNSDNLYAEAMLWQLGLLCDEQCPSLNRIDDYFSSLCRQLGLSAGNYRIADGSGRSLYNYVTPELLCRLLNHAATQPWFGRFRESLPIMGVDGTLKKRSHGTTAQYNVQAKTGTVTGVSSLAGYAVSGEGHLLCFAIINQGVCTGSQGRDFQDKVCCILTMP